MSFFVKIFNGLLTSFWGLEGDPKGMRRLFGLIFQYRGLIISAVACMVGYNLFNALPAWYAKDVVDALKNGVTPTINEFALVGALVFIIFATKGLFFFGHNYLMGVVGQKLIYNLRSKLYKHLQTLSFTFYSSRPAGDLISRFTSDLITLQNAIKVSVVGPLRDIPQIFIFLSILVYRSWELFLVTAILIPIALLLITRFGRSHKRYTGQRLDSYGKMTSMLMETVAGIRVVKAFGMEKYERDRFQGSNDDLYKSNLRSIVVQSYSNPMLETIGALVGAGIIMFGGYLIIQGSITPGDFVSFLLSFFMLNDPIKKLNGFNMQMQEGVASANRVYELLDLEPQEVDLPGAQDIPPISKSISIHVDRFCHDGSNDPVLEDISMDVEVGKVVALVGSSGAGKTTLVNLIPRFFDLKEGKITVDGRDIREVTLSSLRSQVAIVTQEIFLFNDTIANNIAYGNIECPMEDIISAARSAYAHDFIMGLPNGYDTNIGEGGLHLSGGQRQRLSIARALIKNAPILILDEATSALDSESEFEVQKAIEALIRDRTTFVIAHRLSTIRSADRIYVMEKGKVVETGIHEALLNAGGVYKKLHDMQFRDREDFSLGEKKAWTRFWKRVRGSEAPVSESDPEEAKLPGQL